jgi:hypothetical protein
MKKPETRTPRNGTVRCAIYTRKSSEEGLEQEFNSLQAKREACEAFINSQRHEGWVCLRAAYDDGGFSGATMAGRPAAVGSIRLAPFGGRRAGLTPECRCRSASAGGRPSTRV